MGEVFVHRCRSYGTQLEDLFRRVLQQTYDYKPAQLGHTIIHFPLGSTITTWSCSCHLVIESRSCDHTHAAAHADHIQQSEPSVLK